MSNIGNDSEFYDDWVSTDKKNKLNQTKTHEPIYFKLSEFSKNGGCNYCLQSKCNVHNGEKAKDIHPLIKKVIKNPSIILGNVPDILKENNYHFENRHIHVNTCVWNYTHSKCQNCCEDRCKFIKFIDSKNREHELKFCYPVLKQNSNVIPIGFHLDIELEIVDNQIKNFNVFPFDSHTKNDLDIQDKYITENVTENVTHKNYPDLNKNIENKNINSKNMNSPWNFTNEKIKNHKNLDNDDKISKCEDIKNSSSDISFEDKINSLMKENTLLIKENINQKQTINNLKKNGQIDNISVKINDMENTIDKLRIDNKNLKDENLYLSSKKNEFKSKNSLLTEKQIKNISDSTKHFSNTIFESIIRTYYD